MTNPSMVQQLAIVEIVKCTNYHGHENWVQGKATRATTRYKGKTQDGSYYDLTKALAMRLHEVKGLPLTIDGTYSVGVDR